jgi:hypothetical protein
MTNDMGLPQGLRSTNGPYLQYWITECLRTGYGLESQVQKQSSHYKQTTEFVVPNTGDPSRFHEGKLGFQDYYQNPYHQ